MGRGKWTRWGRGSCEGWSLWIGDVLRGQIAPRLDAIGQPACWRASVNQTELGDYATREEAMARVEEAVRFQMGEALADWEVYTAARPRRPG